MSLVSDERVEEMLAEIERLRAQNAELLAALKEVDRGFAPSYADEWNARSAQQLAERDEHERICAQERATLNWRS